MLSYGVIFDMDGVLVDSYAAHLASWKRLAAELGAAITEDQFSATFGRTSREIIRQLFDVTDRETVARYDTRKEALYRDIIRGRVPVMAGAIELVTTLHQAGFRLAVGSSGPPENIALVCEECVLDSMLAGKVSGADVTEGKPDPEVFLLAAERIGVAPERCVVIEDAPSGVEAAIRAGMRCIALAGTVESTRLGQADLVVNRLDEINAATIRNLFV
jgi:beta-phosphoglucomutase